MYTKRDFLKKIKSFCKYRGFVITSFAEETNPATPPANEPSVKEPAINFEQMIARARKEEKDKLYPQIDKLEKENRKLSDSLNTYLLQNAALKEELENLKNAGDSEEVTNLKNENSRLQQEIETLKANTPNEEEIRNKIKDEYEVKLYLQQQIEANKADILSVLVSDITGTTKEEIDKSIQSAKDKTLSVKKDLGLVDDEGNPISTKKKETSTAKKVTRPPVSAPAVEPEGDTFTAEYIRNLDPRSPEYKEFRKKMGLR